MASIKVANFAFLHTGSFTLPNIFASGPQSGKAHIRADEKILFDLPNDVRERGMLSFYWDTGKGADDGIDLTFNVMVNAGSVREWTFKSDKTGGFQIQVDGLRPGQNWVAFTVTKGGRVTIPDPDESLGGKGVIHFAHVCLTYHRDITV